MTLQLWNPPQLTVQAQSCTDEERKISRKCWDLQQIQELVRNKKLIIKLTPSAQTDNRNELSFSGADFEKFICALHAGRYSCSEWCLANKNVSTVPRAADVYIMGFNRFKGEENQKTNPWIYFKFTIKQQGEQVVMIVYSAHPERKEKS